MYEQNNSPESEFLKKVFSDYYAAHFVDSVPQIERREFGYGILGRKIFNRNMAFSSAKEMNAFLVNEEPLFLSYSNACYKYPARKPMPTKELIGADIIYEFDADELGLSVEEIDGHQWFEKRHLDEAKKEVFKLLGFLEKDFAFSTEGVAINFSGKAGYHVHLRGKEFFSLNRTARIELVDYLTGNGMDFGALGYDLSSKQLSCPTGKGLWGKRLNSALKRILDKPPEELVAITGFQKKKVSSLLSAKADLVKSIDKGMLFPVDGRKSSEFWTKMLEACVAEEKSKLDRQTSVDMHKIIRVPETLHGETGMLAKVIPLKDFTAFNPFDDAVVLPGQEVKVFIQKAPRFYLKGKHYGPFLNEEVSVPLFCAVYLIGKGAELR